MTKDRNSLASVREYHRLFSASEPIVRRRCSGRINLDTATEQTWSAWLMEHTWPSCFVSQSVQRDLERI